MCYVAFIIFRMEYHLNSIRIIVVTKASNELKSPMSKCELNKIILITLIKTIGRNRSVTFPFKTMYFQYEQFDGFACPTAAYGGMIHIHSYI